VFFDAGTTFRTVCRQVRMAAACNLLSAHPDKTLREVALAVGCHVALVVELNRDR